VTDACDYSGRIYWENNGGYNVAHTLMPLEAGIAKVKPSVLDLTWIFSFSLVYSTWEHAGLCSSLLLMAGSGVSALLC